MMRMIVFVAVTALLGVVPACASPATGISYDEVVKFTNGDAASSLKTGDFDSDFQTASRPKPRPTFGPILTSMTATRHYIAWPKERLEEPPGQGASITDCDARTSTFLNFKNKTYTVNPVPPQPTETESGSKLSLALTNRALGPRSIGGVPTDGYQSTIAVGMPNGMKSDRPTNIAMTAYFAKMPQVPIVTWNCGASLLFLNLHGGAEGIELVLNTFWQMIAFNETAFLMRALNGDDPHFTVSTSGPALPTNRFPMAVTISFQDRSGHATLALQRAHVAPLRGDDAIFQVPADFTKRL